MIYNTYLECLKNIKLIDYPIELLDIHIYTDNKMIQQEYKIHLMTEIESYIDIKNDYNDYDYIWIINSENIITEKSLLKDCINADKSIVSGLVIKKGQLFSNFWGDITEDGWYKRSENYLDIINQKKIDIWKVPYITGNILIKKEILKKYNLIEKSQFNDIDMIICDTFRKHNEDMYLINNKIYGYIYEDIFEKFNKSSLNEKEILAPEFYEFIHNNNVSLFKEIKEGTDIWQFPFFSEEFCDYLILLAEKDGKWSGGIYNNNKIDPRIDSVENIPTQDIHLKQLGLENFWNYVVNNYFKKIMSHLYHYLTKNYNISFIVKYNIETDGQKGLQAHHDSSAYTTNIALNDDTEYTGGGVKFLTKNITVFNKKKGHMILHPGRITHYHEAISILSGKRYVLVSFNN